MAEVRSETGEREDKGSNTEPVVGDGQTTFCPSCKETYWWMYGEDSMPSSLSCGHTLCYRCAKGQWCDPDTPDTSVFCVTCSAQVGVTTYKCPPPSKPENNAASNFSNSQGIQSAISGNTGAGNSNRDAPVQSTPTHLRSSAGQPASCLSYSGDKVTSALSSPLVLDKIQSQDDSWRLLQHDEGFIRDWIVANVPDHVIFKMVGAGNPEAIVSTNTDNNSFVFSTGNALVVSSPLKTVDTSVTTSEAAGVTSSAPLPAMSSFLGETTGRPTFEQQFLHYLVNKAAHDRPPSSSGDSEDQDLPAVSGGADGEVQAVQEPISEQSGSLVSVSVTSQAESACAEVVLTQGAEQGQAGRVGNKGDCGTLTGKDSQLLAVNRAVRISADGEASQLPAAAVPNTETRSLLKTSLGELATKMPQYGVPNQSLSGLQQPPATVLYDSIHPHSNASVLPPSKNPHYQQHYAPCPPGSSYGSAVGYADHPQRMRFTSASGPMAASYGSYAPAYPPLYSRHEQYGSQCAMPWQYGSGGFQRYPHYGPPRGAKIGRGRIPNLSRPFKIPSQYSWYSKACSSSVNPGPVPRLSTQPQIRFIQVLRPRSENQGMPDHSGVDTEMEVLTQDAPPETPEPSAVEAQETAESEVAVMKTRDMPHGTRVEDIYVVPQVWLSGGQNSLPPDSSIHTNPYTADAQQRDSAAVMHQETVADAHNLSLCETGQEAVEKLGCGLPGNIGIQTFAESEVSMLEEKSRFESQEVQEDSEPALDNLPNSMETKINGTDDGNDYADFQPVALLTTIPVTKAKVNDEQPEEARVLDAPPPLIHASILRCKDSSAVSWEENEETPMRDLDLTQVDDLQRMNDSLQIPLAPTKTIDPHVSHTSALENMKFDSAVLKLPQSDAAASYIPTTTPHYVGTCNKTVQFGLDSGSVKSGLAASQTSATDDDMQVMEADSTVPSAIMLVNPNTAETFPARKRLRRSLASEFYSSGYGGQSRPLRTTAAAGRRMRGRKGRWFPAKHGSCDATCDSSQQSFYPFASRFSYDQRSYLYDSRLPTSSSALHYNHLPPVPAPFLQNPGMQVNSKPSLQLGNESAYSHQSTAFSLLHGTVATSTSFPPCLSKRSLSPSQPYPDVLSHLSSGRGDYSNTPSTYAEHAPHHSYLQDSTGSFGMKTDCRYRTMGSSKQEVMGGVSRRLPFWSANGRNTCSIGQDCTAGDWKIGATGHRVSAEEMETIQRLLHEVTELNKQLQNSVLTNLEGCLALLQSNAFLESKNFPSLVPQGREISDMDHLLHCILSLGQVAVHFGWWCRPHYWDESSERWGEMAMLASDVFEESVLRLSKVVTFYLDHACVVKSCNEEAEDNITQEDLNETAADENNKLDNSVVLQEGDTEEFQHQSQLSQSENRVLMHIAAEDQPESYAMADDQSHTYVTSFDDQDYGAIADQQEAYTTAAYSQSEAYMTSFPQSEVYTTTISQPETCYSLDDQRTNDTRDSFDLRGERLDTDPSVVYGYQVPDATLNTHFSNDGGALDADDDTVAVQSSQVSESWAYHNYRDYSQVYDVTCADTSEPAVMQTVVHRPTPLRYVQAKDGSEGNCTVLPAPDANQPDTEVYYTVEGALAMDFSAGTGIMNSTEAVYSSDERICEDDRTVYAVSHIPESAPDEFSRGEVARYIVSATTVDSVAQVPENLVNIAAVSGSEHHGHTAHPEVSYDPAEVNTETLTGQPPEEMMADHFQSETLAVANTTEITDETEKAASAVTETIFQEADDMSLFRVTVSTGQTDCNVVCTGEEVISDAAIMMSETVEIETDGTVDIQGREGLDPKTEENSSDRKENMDNLPLGKRKRSKAPHSRSKHMKQDADHGKQMDKGALSAKGGKWNLRSSRASPTKSHSPRNSSRRI